MAKNAGVSRSNTSDSFALIVLEVSHPLGPVFGLGVAGSGPGACRVELAMPLQPPQFFETYFSQRRIQKKTVHVPIVSIHAETLYFIGASARSPHIGAIPIICRRLIRGQWSSTGYGTVSKKHDLARPLDVGSSPEIVKSSSAHHSGRVQHPLIYTITAG